MNKRFTVEFDQMQFRIELQSDLAVSPSLYILVHCLNSSTIFFWFSLQNVFRSKHALLKFLNWPHCITSQGVIFVSSRSCFGKIDMFLNTISTHECCTSYNLLRSFSNWPCWQWQYQYNRNLLCYWISGIRRNKFGLTIVGHVRLFDHQWRHSNEILAEFTVPNKRLVGSQNW